MTRIRQWLDVLGSSEWGVTAALMIFVAAVALVAIVVELASPGAVGGGGGLPFP